MSMRPPSVTDSRSIFRRSDSGEARPEGQESLIDSSTSFDGLFTVGLWECETGSFTVQFTGHEFAHLLEGEIHIEDGNGRILQFLPGMQLVFPAGYSGTWHVLQKARKAFTWHELEPVAAAEVEAQ